MTLSITTTCHNAEYHYAQCLNLFIVMLSVVMLNVFMLSAIMLNVVAPTYRLI